MRGTLEKVETKARKRIQAALPGKQRRSRKPWLLALGAAAVGGTALRMIRRRSVSTFDTYTPGPFGTTTPGTATGNPVAGREVRPGEQLVRTGTSFDGTGTGSAPVQPPFGTTPNGGY